MDIIFTLGEIAEAAKRFNEATKWHKVFLFDAEMAAGKTTFIKELCIQHGVEDDVSSPTFSIINEYKTAKGETIFHLDLYRLNSVEEAVQAGVEEVLYSNEICYVEWPTKAAGLMPEDAVEVNIKVIDNDSRNLSVKLP